MVLRVHQLRSDEIQFIVADNVTGLTLSTPATEVSKTAGITTATGGLIDLALVEKQYHPYSERNQEQDYAQWRYHSRH